MDCFSRLLDLASSPSSVVLSIHGLLGTVLSHSVEQDVIS